MFCLPLASGEYNVRFHYAGATNLDSEKNEGGPILSQSLGEVVSNTVKIEIAEQPTPTDDKMEIEALKEVLEKLREEFGFNCFIFDTMNPGSICRRFTEVSFYADPQSPDIKAGKKRGGRDR